MKSQWDFGTVFGLIAGAVCIYLTMIWPEKGATETTITIGDGWRFEQVGWFFQPQSIFIVFGGVLCATLVNYPIRAVLGLGTVFKNVLLAEVFDFNGMIENIVSLAEKARKDGLLSLEAGLNDIDSVSVSYTHLTLPTKRKV